MPPEYQEQSSRPSPVNGMIPAEQAAPGSPAPIPMGSPDYGVVQTDDFQASGDLKMLFQHLKETYEPKAHSESGPIKPMTYAEINREQNRPLEQAVQEIPPTIAP